MVTGGVARLHEPIEDGGCRYAPVDDETTPGEAYKMEMICSHATQKMTLLFGRSVSKSVIMTSSTWDWEVVL
jgi:hypothetical protein